MMKKATLLLITLLLIKGSSFSQSLRTQSSRQVTHQKSVNNSAQRLSYHLNPASIIFTDNMDSDNTVAGLVARGYNTYFRGGAVGVLPEWIQGDPTVFVAYNGPDSGYVGSSFNSVSGTNDVDNWLVLPSLSVNLGDSISFFSQSPTGSIFPDSIRVMFNAAGASLPEDTNWVELGRFVSNTAGIWERMAFAAPATSATGLFAIRHAVVDGGPTGNNSDFIGIDQIDVFSPTIVPVTYDECAGATDINTAFGGAIGVEMTMGPYDNDSATTGPQDPTVGFECFGEPDGTGTAPTLENTLWFTFTGDGSIYFIETGNCAGITNYIDDGDTQLALYSGTCGSLTPVDCNEDGPNATSTTYPAGFTITTSPGTVYYMIVDGFNFNGALSNGQFCLKITKQAPILCNDPSVTVGTETQNDTNICWLDTLVVSTAGALSSNVGSYFGIGWIISSASITGNADPLNDPSVLGTYTFTSPAPAVSSRSFINDGTFAPVQPGATYYWTPVVFGNATAAAPPQFFGDLTLDPACTITGTSLAANMLVAGDPLCSVGINENVPGKSSSLVAFPSPVKDVLKIEFTNTSSGIALINITDNTGRMVQSNSMGSTKGFNSTSINVKSLASGSYFVNVKTNEGLRTIRFIKD